MSEDRYEAFRKLKKLKRIKRGIANDPEKVKNYCKVKKAIRAIKETFGFE